MGFNLLSHQHSHSSVLVRHVFALFVPQIVSRSPPPQRSFPPRLPLLPTPLLPSHPSKQQLYQFTIYETHRQELVARFIPIFLDRGDERDDEEVERLGKHGETTFALDPSSPPRDSIRPSRVRLVPDDFEHGDAAYSAPPLPSPRRAFKTLGNPVFFRSRRAGPLTPGDEDGQAMMSRRDSIASSTTDLSTSGVSTGSNVGLGMKRDEPLGVLSLTGTFGQRRSFKDGEDEEEIERREADRLSRFSLF